MRYRTIEIIKLIPLNEEIRAKLLKEYDTYSEGKKFDVSSVIWSIFVEWTEILVDNKFKQLLDEAQMGKRELTTDLDLKAKDAVNKDYEDMLNGTTQDTAQIEKLREKLKSLSQLNTLIN
ncbi:MAG: hypothetical protein Q7R95_11075 [bacterium]|nr:hypothetical protein [bacterium]